MIPEARLAAAAAVLDRHLAGEPVEKALTNWARSSRYAGSKDRAAVRDHVFAAIRRRRSAAALGGSESGRGLMIGLLRAEGRDPAAWLTGEGYALSPMTAAEASAAPILSETEALDCPDWLAPELRRSLGTDFAPVMRLMQQRADVFLRVNIARTDREAAQHMLAGDGIETRPHPLSGTALAVTRGERRIRACQAYLDGLVEIQDAASQAVSDLMPLPDDGSILDLCAGGGGKALALAARGASRIFAHDANHARMKDLPGRAARAGCRITCLDTAELAAREPFDLVVADVPCSGSGAWRRQPEAKWRLDAAGLAALGTTQREILGQAARLCAPGGRIAYVTCSLLEAENEHQARWFAESHPGWTRQVSRRFSPLEGGDGFFLQILRAEG